MADKKKFAFIGAGPTTMGAIFRLHELIKEGKLKEDEIQVTVIERERVAGGLAVSVIDDNDFSWDMGVHIHAHPSKYEMFTRCIDEAIPDWNLVRRCVKADMGHIFNEAEEGLDSTQSYVPYPVQMAVPMFPTSIRDQCMHDLRSVQAETFEGKPKDFGDWTYRAFGKKLVEVFVRPYNKKVWTVSLEEMNSHWVGDRVAKVDVAQLTEMCTKTRKQLESDADIGWGPNTFFRYPEKLRGCGFEWQEVHKLRPQHWFRFRHEALTVDAKNKIMHARNMKEDDAKVEVPYDYLLSTMPITILGKISGVAPDIKLQHSKVVLVGIGIKKPQPPFFEKMNWAYYPAPDLPFYRVTFLSNFNKVMTPDNDKYWSVVMEIGLRPDEPVDQPALIEKTIDGLISRGLFADRDQVVDRWSTLLEYGYPIPTVNRDEELRKAHQALQAQQIYSRGRFGGWKYEVANQDHSFAQGYEWVDNILFGVNEKVYDAFA